MRYFLNITLLYILAGDEEWIRRIVWKFICIFCWSKIILHKRGTWPPRKNYYFHNGSKVRHLNVRTNKMWRATLVDIGWFLWAKNTNQDQQLLYLPTSNLSIRPWAYQKCTTNFISSKIAHYYHPSMKLREGYGLTGVCLSVHGKVPMWTLPMMHWTSLYRVPLTPAPRHGTWGPPGSCHPGHKTKGNNCYTPSPSCLLIVTFGSHYWIPVQTYSLDLTVQPSPPPMYWRLVATEAGTVDKRVVPILL